MDDKQVIEKLQNKIQLLETEIDILRTKLKTYTQPKRNKMYYENHKDELLQKSKEYKDKLSAEKKKEYARRAYLNKKEKLQKIKELESI